MYTICIYTMHMCIIYIHTYAILTFHFDVRMTKKNENTSYSCIQDVQSIIFIQCCSFFQSFLFSFSLCVYLLLPHSLSICISRLHALYYYYYFCCDLNESITFFSFMFIPKRRLHY